jgi:hypothetical protein
MSTISQVRFRNTTLTFKWVKDGQLRTVTLLGVRDNGRRVIYELELHPGAGSTFVLAQRISIIEVRFIARKRA